jgi:hypothetical protein
MCASAGVELEKSKKGEKTKKKYTRRPLALLANQNETKEKALF